MCAAPNTASKMRLLESAEEIICMFLLAPLCVLIGKCFAWVIRWCLLVNAGNIAGFVGFFFVFVFVLFFWSHQLSATKTKQNRFCSRKLHFPCRFLTKACSEDVSMKERELNVMVGLRFYIGSLLSGYRQPGPYFQEFYHKKDWLLSLMLPRDLENVINIIFPLT